MDMSWGSGWRRGENSEYARYEMSQRVSEMEQITTGASEMGQITENDLSNG
jgi:hypothetical protein